MDPKLVTLSVASLVAFTLLIILITIIATLLLNARRQPEPKLLIRHDIKHILDSMITYFDVELNTFDYEHFRLFEYELNFYDDGDIKLQKIKTRYDTQQNNNQSTTDSY